MGAMIDGNQIPQAPTYGWIIKLIMVFMILAIIGGAIVALIPKPY